jgi:hypothetical protein
MYNISHKYKGFALLLLKLFIVAGACYFIYLKLANDQLLTFQQLSEQFQVLFSHTIWMLLGVLLFTDANWILETYKWKTLASIIKKTAFFEAFEQSLASLTTSLITPNRIGEYGAKALYFKKNERKKIVVLNFIGNFTQLLVTLFFGIIGLLYILKNHAIPFPKLNIQKIGLFLGILLILFLFRKQLGWHKIAHYYTKFKNFLKEISTEIYIKTIIFSFGRYLIFSHQFYFLMLLFGVEIDYFTCMSFIFTMYFIASLIPSLSIFDWAIKGSVAVWLFHFKGLNELTILTITTLMWILNFAIPAIFGSIFVLTFKLPETKC